MAHPILADDALEYHLNRALIDDVDPYSLAIAIIAHTLEVVLGKGPSGGMNDAERNVLELLVVLLTESDPGYVAITPKAV